MEAPHSPIRIGSMIFIFFKQQKTDMINVDSVISFSSTLIEPFILRTFQSPIQYRLNFCLDGLLSKLAGTP